MENFDPIHLLLKNNQCEDVLLAVLDKDDIKSPYRAHLNHAWYVVGEAFYQMHKVNSSLMAFKKALSCDSNDYDAMFAIGNCYLDLALPYRAFSFFSRVYDKTDNHDALYNMGNCYFDLADYVNARIAYHDIPESAQCYALAQKNLTKTIAIINSRHR